jgi:hypothetical protein
VAALQHAAAGARKREHAALSLLGMLGGAFVLGSSGGGESSRSAAWFKRGVALLAVANGAVGLALHLQSAGLQLAWGQLPAPWGRPSPGQWAQVAS